MKVFTEYFRDIYSASETSCAGICDSATPAASLGPEGYDIRKCCKSACSSRSVTSLSSCETDFCTARCNDSHQIKEGGALAKCVEICSIGCRERFSTARQ